MGQNVVLYLRISTLEQQRGYGLDSQRSLCEDYCQRCGYTLVATLSDVAVSGVKGLSERPGLAQAITLCENGTASVLVAAAQDRFSRATGLFDELREQARKHGYRLETADGRVLTDEEDELSGDAMAFVATIERKLIAKRMKNGRRERSKRDGRGSGPLPYGYRREGAAVVVDEDQAQVVRRILALKDSGASYRAIAEALNGVGCVTARGKPWGLSGVQVVVNKRRLYETGVRVWSGIEAAEQWEIINE
jgi:DNA invertase Pin-like site-specific DNA recombinase